MREVLYLTLIMLLMNLGKMTINLVWLKGRGTINESEIVESEEAHFGKFEKISENYSGQEEHSDSSEYAYPCSDSNDNADVDF